MGVAMRGTYTGGLRMRLTHGPSGTEIATAAPVDNEGDGSSFSPTDLLAVSLGACMVTTMAIVARREGIPFEGAAFRLEKEMAGDPRRVAAVPVVVTLPAALTEAQRGRLERVGLACPVARSLHPDVRLETRFEYA